MIGHRGASGYRPDHTLESYKLAIDMGADFIEPDLVATWTACWWPATSPTSPAPPMWPPAPGRQPQDHQERGRRERRWFVSDFTTLAELKTLRAVQPLSDRDQSYNGKFQIPRLKKCWTWPRPKAPRLGRTVGVYPETKHPTYHAKLGLPLEDRLLAVLACTVTPPRRRR